MRFHRVCLFLLTTFLAVGCTSTAHTPATPATGGTTTVAEAQVSDTTINGTTSPPHPQGTFAASAPATSVPHLGLYCVLPTLPGGGIASCMTTRTIPTCSSPVIVGTGPCWIDGAPTETTPAGDATIAQNLP